MAFPKPYRGGAIPRSLALVFFAVLAVPAAAGNLATEWIDNVTHEVQQEEGPLSARPFDFHVYGGVYGYYTDNLFLAPHHLADGDSAAIGFGRGTVSYTDSRLEIAADLLINYNCYAEHHADREDEEHLFGKIRWTDGVFDLQLVEVARRESDALDGVFTDRARRIITDTLPRFGVKIPDAPTIEASGQIETVHYQGSVFDAQENENYRGGVAGLMDLNQRLAVGVDAGYLRIHYTDFATTPSAEGFYAHALLRGEIFHGLLVEAAAGWSYIHGFRTEVGDTHAQRNSTFDAEIHLRYELTQTLTLFADYTRRFGFAGIGNTYEVVDRGIVIAEWQATDRLKFRARGQYDHVVPSLSEMRSYWAADLSSTLQVVKHLSVNGGVTYRGGRTQGIAGSRYTNWIFYLGAIVDF